MAYKVKEIFLTSQGEGMNMGRTAVFLRFSGCNLWSGREKDRATAICKFCDTDFVGGVTYKNCDTLADKMENVWGLGLTNRFCVITGGEPLLQLDGALIDALHERNFEIAVETNGTIKAPYGGPLTGPRKIDWICVSPKQGTELALTHADELKIVFPQGGLDPADFLHFNATHRWLSPMDNAHRSENTRVSAEYCKKHPEWRLAIQAHKTWSIP